ncbi:phosphoglucomutase isoform X2 [Microplitis demolitor]|uniref:phosphoglucomutase isoform X2 n=1 Tax=Microplitis demolitor TaxID=69319 RepID=UPI0006D4EC5A|nr:phosphoglucomutase isoform X2 [Microplitis demolitor]
MYSTIIPTKVYYDQKPGTSGLRKPVKTFQQEHYTENFIQSIFEVLKDNLNGALVVGGDGRYYCKEAVEKIIRIAAANGIKQLIIGQNGILSTPAVSTIIRKYKTLGGIVLTASHNPGGPNADFGIKLNCENGGPAPDNITEKIYEITKTLKSYSITPTIDIDITKIQSNSVQVDGRTCIIDVIDSVEDYVMLMKEIFDFSSIKKLFEGNSEKRKFNILVDCLNGVTGPYAKRIFGIELGVDSESIVHATPLEDFGGLHPDPNLTYAADMVNTVRNGVYDMGAAFDGDGDRNMIIGKNAFFVTPSDSLAVLAAYLKIIPYFQKTGVKGYARSMPTSAAIDRVAKHTGISCFEVPTGWKYFGNLMDAARISLCGEESFGTGSDHIREKDGIWACLAWLNIISELGKPIECILKDHWYKYGRNFYLRYDYENCDSDDANKVMSTIEAKIGEPNFISSKLSYSNKQYTVVKADNYSYKDTIDGSVAIKQGFRILFDDDSRIIYRLSGTGSTGATIRIYVECYESDKSNIMKNVHEVLKPLISMALELSELQKHTGREKPSVIT